MSENRVTVYLNNEQFARMERYAAETGVSSTALVMRQLAFGALDVHEGVAEANPIVDKVMAEMKRRTWPIAVRCEGTILLECIKHDAALYGKFKTLNAAESYEFIERAAKMRLGADGRKKVNPIKVPELFERLIGEIRRRSEAKEGLVALLPSLNSCGVLYHLDSADAQGWLKAMADVRIWQNMALAGEKPSSVHEEAYEAAKSLLSGVLERMGICERKDLWRLNEGEEVYEIGRGWYLPDEKEAERRRTRKHGDFWSGIDELDENWR